MAYLIITHLSGSKSNQKEKFPLEGLQTITMGRDPSSNIAYDPEMDDIVSREHARIEQDPPNPFELTLTDLNSSNGVFVNKIKLHSSILINHGDIVQLGKNGPEFRFGIDHPPPEKIKSTRLAGIPKEFIPKTRKATIPSPSSFDSAAGVSGTGRSQFTIKLFQL